MEQRCCCGDAAAEPEITSEETPDLLRQARLSQADHLLTRARWMERKAKQIAAEAAATRAEAARLIDSVD